MAKQIYNTNIISSKSYDELNVIENGYVVKEDDLIIYVGKDLPLEYKDNNIIDYTNYIMIPGFSDLHIHASQYVQRGIGMDYLLVDWLNHYTFPQERGFENIEYAKTIYPQLIRDLLRHGTLHASFYTTIHYDACDLFFKMLIESEMYAYTGKINMDQNAPDYYIEETNKSLIDTERFILEHKDTNKVKNIITPRFAPTCSKQLLLGLAKLIKKYNLPMQTHLVESKAEAAWAKELFNEYKTDGDIYDKLGLLDADNVKIFAHVIFPTEIEEKLLQDKNCFAIHCPDSTNNIIAGIMPTNYLHEKGIQIGLGSDIGGGHFVGIYKQIAKTIQLSKLKEFYEENNKTLTFTNAFYLATAEGGKAFGNVGKIEKDYKFNCLLIDKMNDIGHNLTLEESIERFSYIGDDRNIYKRFIDGKEIDPEEIYQKLINIFK